MPASSAIAAIAAGTAALDLDTAENTIVHAAPAKLPPSALALSDFLLPEIVSLRLCAQRTNAAARGAERRGAVLRASAGSDTLLSDL
jgi:hypothetical protein